MALPPILNKQVGPFKLWVWGAFVGAGVGIGILWRAMGSPERGPSEEDKAPPPVIATEPVGYVYADEGEGQARTERPDYTPPVQQGPQPGAPIPPTPTTPTGPPVNPPRRNIPPITGSPTPPPNTPTKRPAPANFRASLSADKKTVNVAWNNPGADLRVQVNDGSTSVFRSAYNASSGSFAATQGKTYNLRAYSFDAQNKFSDGSAPQVVNVSGAPSGEGTRSYPGLAPGYQMDCQTTTLTHIVRDLSEVETSGSTTSKARKLSAWAIANTGSPSYPNYASIFWSGIAQAGVRESVNRDRVRYGLYPLTNADFDTMQADMRRMMPNGPRDEASAIYQSGNYARELFAKYNAPYQCKGGGSRTTMRDVTGDTRVRS